MKRWWSFILTLALVQSTLRSLGGEQIVTDANWVNYFPAPQFYGGGISAMTLDNRGNLYVGGSFVAAGSVMANYVAKWDGTNWSALGSGMDDYVTALVVDTSGNLYAGGAFEGAGGVTVKGVAKWDGSSWSALGSGMGEPSVVCSLALDRQGNLYAGGNFNNAGGVPANHIAKWNGTTWSALGGGITGAQTESDYPGPTVLALTFDTPGNLYAGGAFTTAGGVAASSLAVWNGSSWSAAGTGLSGGNFQFGIPTPEVDALMADGASNVYVGGQFTNAGGISANSIAKWDGKNWSTFGTGVLPFEAGIHSLALDASGHLYVGGTFEIIGGISARNIAEWNGSGWNALGSGTYRDYGSYIYSLVFDRSENLDVGGDFTLAGTNVSYSIAQVLLSPTSYGLSVQRLGPGTNIIRGFGTPGYAYALDMATNLISPVNWTPLITNTQTNINLIFTNATTSPRGFYRTRYVPQ
jgi:trimeric autotransporter adhesin